MPCMKQYKVNGSHSMAVYQNDDRKIVNRLIEQGRVWCPPRTTAKAAEWSQGFQNIGAD